MSTWRPLDESGGAAGDVAGAAEHRNRTSGCRLTHRECRIGAGRAARARGRADRINHRTGGARQAGTPAGTRLAALGSERCANAFTAGQPRVRSGTQRGAVVRPGWLRRALTLGKASDAFGFELRKLRLAGGTQANPLLTAAAIDGVQPREAIRVGRTGSNRASPPPGKQLGRRDHPRRRRPHRPERPSSRRSRPRAPPAGRTQSSEPLRGDMV